MISSHEMASLQRAQYAHDMRNHFDILSLHKNDRLKHYGLHFAKYVGRLAREIGEEKPVERTLVDAALVSLSAANTLHQDLSRENFERVFKYWSDRRFARKKALMNGSLVQRHGDNIYHADPSTKQWIQEDSFHSQKGESATLTISE